VLTSNQVENTRRGLEGSLTTIDGLKRETFQVFLGGGVEITKRSDAESALAYPSDQLTESLTRLFARYKSDSTTF
jgi:hypothetical protein